MIQHNEYLPRINELFKQYGGEDIAIKIIHIRDEKDQKKDVWNDALIFVDKDYNVWSSLGTTDPGSNAYLRHPEGAGHVCLGLHKQCWVIDIHAANNKAFKHEALCSRPQYGCKPIKFWRDKDKDRIYDTDEIILQDYIGVNCHRASAHTGVPTIGDYSDMCQVRKWSSDHNFMMNSLKEFDIVKDTLENKRYTYKFSFLLVSNTEFYK